MGLRARILRVVGETGPRKKTVLLGLARGEKQLAQFEDIFQTMIDQGELVMLGDKRGATYGPPRQRGFGTMELVIFVAIVALMAALVALGYRAGANAKQAAWDKEKLADITVAKARDARVQAVLRTAFEEVEKHGATARQYEAKWKEAQREARRNHPVLASCSPSQDAADAGGGGGRAPLGAGQGIRPLPAGGDRAHGAPGIRLHWRFVGLHDGAFTGIDGKPLFGDSAGFALEPSRADTPSPYGLDELLEVHGENARALSTCVRYYAEAIERLDAAVTAWEKSR